jgi:sterol desaturase/sphingolipid hydroxylase (fatty acid hydroxylase superfamily)
VRFLFAAGLAWLFFYVLRRERWLSRKIIQGFPSLKDLGREAALSALTCGIYGIVGVCSWMAVRGHWIHPYFRPHLSGRVWFWASIIITIFLHDTYFYWTHRLMHLPRLFPWMHRSHHRSTNPTPWAAYAFDPLEAVVQGGIFPLVLILYPIPPVAFLLFMAWQITFNVLGHSGFEIYPGWFMDSWLGKFFNTPTNHAMHHQYFRGNYGLYFNVWDRLMGTNHSQYEERFRHVTGGKNACPS